MAVKPGSVGGTISKLTSFTLKKILSEHFNFKRARVVTLSGTKIFSEPSLGVFSKSLNAKKFPFEIDNQISIALQLT